MSSIAIVDYGLDDLSALKAAFEEVGADAQITSDGRAINKADGVVLAGSAAFAEAIAALADCGLEEVCRAAIWDKKPFLGINVGMHLFFSVGCEITKGCTGSKVVDGMEIRPGSVTLLPSTDFYGSPFELPHEGMHPVLYDERCSSPLLQGIPDGQEYYFDHSFVAPTGPWVHGWATYSAPIPAVIDFHRTCYGVQFIPEKSGKAGLAILKRFAEICDNPEQLEEKVERYASLEELAL